MYQELEIILNDSILSAVAVLFHTFCIDDKISFSQVAQASASQFYTTHSMYQERENILNDSILSVVPALFHTFCNDDNISSPKHRLVLVSSIHMHIACTKMLKLCSVVLFCLQSQYCSVQFAKMATFLCPKHRLVVVISIHQHIACTKK